VSPDISIIARAYCQRARLIRRSLLAAHHLAPIAACDRVFDRLQPDPRAQLAEAVLERLDGPILRYSMRLELLGIARRLRLSRFDACLIIAQVQHRAANGPAAPVSPRPSQGAPRPLQRFLPLAIAGMIQLGIVAAAWVILS